MNPRIDVYDTMTSDTFSVYRMKLERGKVDPLPRYCAEIVLDEYVTDLNYPGATSISACGDTPEAAREAVIQKLMNSVKTAEVVFRD